MANRYDERTRWRGERDDDTERYDRDNEGDYYDETDEERFNREGRSRQTNRGSENYRGTEWDQGRNRGDYGNEGYDTGSRRGYGRGEHGYGNEGRDYGRNRYSTTRRIYGTDYEREDYGTNRGGYNRTDYGGNYGREEYGTGRGTRSLYGTDYGRGDYESGGYAGSRDFTRGDRGRWTGETAGGRYYQYRGQERYGSEGYGYGQGGYGGEDWQQRGPYTGRGPKGYHRSDDRIREDISERLTQHGQIDATDIEVDVNKGEVWLKGGVESRQMKRLAEDVAESVNGVCDVHNELRVFNRNAGQNQSRETQYGTTGMRQTGTGTTYGTTTGTSYDTGRTTGTSYSTGSTTGGTGTRTIAGQGQTATGEGTGRRQVRTGMTVYGSDDQDIGQVKEVRGNDFLVDRALARDIYVPFSAVRSAQDDRVTLNIESSEIDNQGWENPELTAVGDMGGSTQNR